MWKEVIQFMFMPVYALCIPALCQKHENKSTYQYLYLYGHAVTVASSVRRPANRRALRSPNAPDLPEGAK